MSAAGLPAPQNRSLLSQLLDALYLYEESAPAIRKALARYAQQVENGDLYFRALELLSKTNETLELAIEDTEARGLSKASR